MIMIVKMRFRIDIRKHIDILSVFCPRDERQAVGLAFEQYSMDPSIHSIPRSSNARNLSLSCTALRILHNFVNSTRLIFKFIFGIYLTSDIAVFIQSRHLSISPYHTQACEASTYRFENQGSENQTKLASQAQIS